MDEKIVYIIIVVIWVVSSLIKAFNKKKKPQTPPKTSQSEKPKPAGELDDFKKILEEIISGKQQMPQPQQVDDYVETVTPEYNYEPASATSKYASYEGATDYNFNQYASLEDTYINDNKRINFEKTQDNAYKTNSIDETTNNEKIFYEDFDIRKAVIYSEILKRPHY